MTNINAGSLRTRATFTRPSASRGSRGQVSGSATTLGRRTVQVKWLSGSEAEQAKQVFSSASVEVTMRKPRDFTLIASDKMLIDGTTYGIGAVIPSDEKFHDLRLLCEVLQ